MKKDRRIKILQTMGIITLALISMYYINELFGSQISVFRSAVNSILLPFGIALFMSYLLQPLVTLLEEKAKIKKRILTVIIVFIIVIAVLTGFTYFVGDIIYKQGVSFLENDLESIVDWFNNFIAGNDTYQDIYNTVISYINFENAQPVIFNAVNILRGLSGLIVVIVLIPVFLFFLLKEKETIFKGIVSVVPKNYQNHAKELGKRANYVIQKYFNGRFLSMLVMSILLSIMFFAFGFNFGRAIFFGFILGFLDIIPYIGSFIGLLLPVLYSFTVQDTLWLGEWTFIGLIGVNGVLQAFQGNILQPYIMGKEVNLHPLLVLVSFIFFGVLFGITGIILAIPITGIIKTSVEYFNELKANEKAKIKPKKITKTKAT
ncbi:AI-2 transport protein TqsA [Candidatus Izimaplasma bacterium HR1]|jgi:putative permease|uniref:AI-2E family transporter n=1 Tax=Candidatus Izimoplasma sp. HR1 TaxID=1541959 RepID=UPI0004F8445F|nr:AI-2 transport protein TqsA [Candidatus Izimaplasma bacterium HR1]